MVRTLTPQNTSPSKERWLQTAQDESNLAQALDNISSQELEAWKKTEPAFFSFLLALAQKHKMSNHLRLKHKQKNKK